MFAALRALRQSACARVVAVTSFAVSQMPGGRADSATSAAKGARQTMAMSFAVKMARDGITVNCVSPGFTVEDSTAHTAMAADAFKAGG
ncbi:MAG: SDR family oxidoreductase [Granulosicoccus sp.]